MWVGENMDVSVIIVNYCSAKLVMDTVRSIKEKTSGVSYEILVVDNASGDGSVEVLREALGEDITLIASSENLGFGKANNLAAKQAKGEMLFLLNPDTILVNNAIYVLYLYLKDHPEVGVAGGNLYFPNMMPAPSFCRAFSSPEDEERQSRWGTLLKKRFLRAKQAGKMQEFNYTDQPEEVAYIFGADMMMPKAIFEQVGGFDPDFFMYGEETELTWRITQQGYKVVCVPQSKIVHLEGATTKSGDAFSERQFGMRMNGTLLYYDKCFVNGAERFYRARRRRYTRQIQLASFKRRLPKDHTLYKQVAILDREYHAFCGKRGEG